MVANLKGNLVDLKTDLTAKPNPHQRPLERSDPDSVIAEVAALVTHLRDHAHHYRVPGHIIGRGVEVGGHVNGDVGDVVFSTNLGWQEPVALGKRLRQKTGLVTIVALCVNALAV